MFQLEDDTYHEILRKSVDQWLEEMQGHSDVAVRCGVKAAREYMARLEKKATVLEEKNILKDQYLKKLKGRG